MQKKRAFNGKLGVYEEQQEQIEHKAMSCRSEYVGEKRPANSQAELELTKEIKTHSKRFLATKIKREQRKRKWCGNSASIGAKIKVNLILPKKTFEADFSNYNIVVQGGKVKGIMGIKICKWKLP